MRIKIMKIQFEEYIPETVHEGTLYISMEYATASHKCACGCGEEVITPFSPTDWKLVYDGESVTLTPSIGNWSYPCRSHYLIQKNKVVWAGDMSQEAIEAGRHRDKSNKTRHYSTKTLKGQGLGTPTSKGQPPNRNPKGAGLWRKVLSLFGFHN